ncbi:UNVERIFIED_CONTAM: hypothetical protein Sradi_4374300 [Sesamum radiatum]|uniref:Reverse transcriptase/retrotransposon-derived protein RNase H-like domain-containing protein n=1 Tax=Sesamum radiatum TaxID=300843 RepID=A0AAW2NR48_SESRA
MHQPLHPYGTILNLDISDFRNTEKLIDEWVAALKIAATTLELDRENFIRLVELSLEGSVKIGWDNTLEDTKANILAGDSKSAIAERLGRLMKIHFIRDGYFEGSRAEKARKYTQALFGLELRNICAVDEYIYWFRIFIKDLAKYRKDFRPLLKETESSRWKWEEIHTQRVRELKQFCSNLPKLVIPQDEDELVVYTDANDYRWATVLMKKATIGEEPCRYTGGLFSEQQAQVWHINEKEFFAIWKAFKK